MDDAHAPLIHTTQGFTPNPPELQQTAAADNSPVFIARHLASLILTNPIRPRRRYSSTIYRASSIHAEARYQVVHHDGRPRRQTFNRT